MYLEPYYFGGYFLIKPRPLSYGPVKNSIIQTCSSCINISAFDVSWCLSWTQDISKEEKAELELTDETIAEIQKWADQKFNEGAITWGNALPDLETVTTFRDLFFSGKSDIRIYSMYFSKTDTEYLIEDFDFEGESNYKGQFGIRENLQKKILENDSSTEEFLGYDLIGVEEHGGFHSFHCHNIISELLDKFSLSLNKNGLFDSVPNPDMVRDYLNDETTRVEPVPWYIAKTKRLLNHS